MSEPKQVQRPVTSSASILRRLRSPQAYAVRISVPANRLGRCIEYCPLLSGLSRVVHLAKRERCQVRKALNAFSMQGLHQKGTNQRQAPGYTGLSMGKIALAWLCYSPSSLRTIATPSTSAFSFPKPISRGRYFMPQSGARDNRSGGT